MPSKRELRIQAAEKRTAPKKPKAQLSNQEFRNPHRDPNMMQVIIFFCLSRAVGCVVIGVALEGVYKSTCPRYVVSALEMW